MHDGKELLEALAMSISAARAGTQASQENRAARMARIDRTEIPRRIREGTIPF
jgi:hypothetical protein